MPAKERWEQRKERVTYENQKDNDGIAKKRRVFVAPIIGMIINS